MASSNGFQLWFFLGLLFGALIALQAVTIADASSPAAWINQYQALISALIAIAAAILTLAGAMWIESERRRDRQQAARAMLPFTLKKIAENSKDTVRQLTALLPKDDSVGPAELVVGKFQAGEVPERALENIREAIETAPRHIRRALVDLLVSFQMYRSRLFEIDHSNENRYNTNITLADLRCRIPEQLEIYARTLRCLMYGRFDSETIELGPILLSEIQLAAHHCKLGKQQKVVLSDIERLFPVDQWDANRRL